MSAKSEMLRLVLFHCVKPQNGGISLKNSVIRRGDNRLYFARQASSAQGFFMRQASATGEVPSIPYLSSFLSGD